MHFMVSIILYMDIRDYNKSPVILMHPKATDRSMSVFGESVTLLLNQSSVNYEDRKELTIRCIFNSLLIIAD